MEAIKVSDINNFIISEAKFENIKTTRVGILASGNGTNFENLVRLSRKSKLNIEIPILIVNNDNCGAQKIAKKNNIHCVLINHRNYNNREDFDKIIISEFKKKKIEWIVMAGWMRIASSFLIDAYSNRIINIHPSLLPSFKGGKAINDSLNSGVKITGCTAHIVNNDLDSGPIIMQAATIIDSNDNLDSLTKKIQQLEYKVLPLSINKAIYNFK
tara:strand:- start:40 stop:681 length:642 start_codon:yes stop_codon:yes gene_type:complete